MIAELIDSINNFGIHLPINLLAHTIIFLGTFYVAIHNRQLKQWHITPLWYVGLTSLLNAITILLYYIYGSDFELGYGKLGVLTETISNVSLAFIAGIMLYATLVSDLRGRKNRVNN